jgi:hypothetical protein
MSFVDERTRGLILDLLRARIREDEFYRAFPLKPGEGSRAGQAMLVRALNERDAIGVEFGLYLGHRFGICEECLDVLLGLAGESWHERHEDVVDALVKLKSARSVESLLRTAKTRFPYRDYDESNSLGVKCIRALGALYTRDAVSGLGDLVVSGDPNLEREAEAQLQCIANQSPSGAIRVAAREALTARRPGTRQ